MRRAQKATRIQAILDELIPDTPIPLLHKDPFTLLVAVLLSAQTTDARVNEVTPALFRAGGTPARMAQLGEDEILGYIRRIGLAPTKARNVKSLAQQLLDEHGGHVPKSFKELDPLAREDKAVVLTRLGETVFTPNSWALHYPARAAKPWGTG